MSWRAFVLVLVAAVWGGTAAHAEVMPVDPGDIAAGRPLAGTGQNLPPITGADIYDAGPLNAAALRAVYESGDIARLQREVTRAARRDLRRETGCRTPGRAYPRCRVMVVFDVDDTLVSNYPQVSTNAPAFTWDDARYDSAVAACETPVIPAGARLYRWVRRQGIATAVISGRSASQRADTARCLRQHGITGWERLVTRRTSDDAMTAARFKARARAQLARRGWRIVASVGDQVSDMAYGHLRRGYLLPNLMYWLP